MKRFQVVDNNLFSILINAFRIDQPLRRAVSSSDLYDILDGKEWVSKPFNIDRFLIFIQLFFSGSNGRNLLYLLLN